MTTDCKLSVKKTEGSVSSSTPIIALDGQPVPNTAPMVLIEGGNSRRYVQSSSRRFLRTPNLKRGGYGLLSASSSPLFNHQKPLTFEG